MRRLKVAIEVHANEAEWEMLKRLATEMGYYHDYSTDISAVKQLLKDEGYSALLFIQEELRQLQEAPPL